jgi:hypothetical protein
MGYLQGSYFNTHTADFNLKRNDKCLVNISRFRYLTRLRFNLTAGFVGCPLGMKAAIYKNLSQPKDLYFLNAEE